MTSITFGLGFTHDLGAPCWHCRTNEARCAWRGQCCDDCTHRFAADDAPAGRPRLPIEHGTERGHGQHRTRGEPPCNACRAAHSLYNQRRAAS